MSWRTDNENEWNHYKQENTIADEWKSVLSVCLVKHIFRQDISLIYLFVKIKKKLIKFKLKITKHLKLNYFKP